MEAQLEEIFEEIKELPKEKWGEAKNLIQQLSQQSEAEKWAILDEAFGSLKGEKAKRLTKALEDCERIDYDD